MAWDILIRGGTVIDGSGSVGEAGDVAIAGGHIARLGRGLPRDAARIIDAEGLAVTPGFIDIKTHSDFTLPINPKAESKVRQGVTTEIIGHCGFSVAPVLPGKAQMLADYLSGGAPWLPFREMSFPDYLDSFPKVAVNAGMLVGHNTLRLMAMGLEDRAPSPAELDQMIALLDEGLGAGALGLSTGLFTPPGSFAEPSEIMALCEVVARHRAGYFTHIRDESNKVLEAVEEAIGVARAYPIHVEIVHLKCSGVDNWGKAAEILARIERARDEGCDIDCDAYPYIAGANPLKNLLPPWVQVGDNNAMLARLALLECRARIEAELAEPAAARREDHRRARRRTRGRSDRSGLRSLNRRQWRDPGADRLDLGRRYPHDRALADGPGRLRRQLRRRLRYRRAGPAASALLRHV